MKKLLIFMLALVIVFSCCACNNNEDEPEVEHITLTPAEYNANSYRVNEWRVEGTKDYYTVLATYGDFYATIDEEDVLYLTDTYHPFKEVFEGSEITIYNMNTTDSGVGAYIKIHTNRLIDLNKVFIVTEGMAKRIDGINTKEEFVAAGNEAKSWIKFYTSVLDKTAPFNDINALSTNGTLSVIAAPDARVCCDSTNYEMITEDNKITIKCSYDTFTVLNADAMKAMILNNFKPAAVKDGVVTEILMPDGLEMFCDIDKEYLYIGIQSTENKPISEYNVEYILNVSSPNMKFALKTE